MTAVTIQYEPVPNVNELALLTASLIASNNVSGPLEHWQRVTFFARTPTGEIIGGLDGYTHWGWLFVRQLWVRPDYQRYGYGRQLMHAAEQAALARGCDKAHLDTFDFQAVPFYQKLGYVVFGQLADYPVGHTRYFLFKPSLSYYHGLAY